jgi:hypothetical protein
MAAVERQVFDSRRGAVADVESDNRFSQQTGKVMRDKAVATTNIQDIRISRDCACYFQRHIVRAAHFSPPPHTLETPLNRVA